MKFTSNKGLALAITFGALGLLSVGCKTAPERKIANAPAPATKCVQRPDDAPEGSKFICHLSCSGKEIGEFSETEDEGMKKVRTHVKATCKPEDGQYFTFCSCLQ